MKFIVISSISSAIKNQLRVYIKQSDSKWVI